MFFDDFISRFTVEGTCGNEYRVLCPCCGHKKLYITQIIDYLNGNHILLHCKHGCDYKDILDATDLKPKDLYENHHNNYSGNTYSRVREHIYTGENGEPVAMKRIIKYTADHDTKNGNHYKAGDKCCLWFRYDNDIVDFKSEAGLDGYKPPLYHLPFIKESDTVLIVEGEKDCETLESMGFTATSSPNGAGANWRSEYNKWLRGKKCYIIADNDEAGNKYAEKAAESLTSDNITAYIIPAASVYQDISEKDDISDIALKLGMDKTAELLRTAMENAEVYVARKPEKQHDNNRMSRLMSFAPTEYAINEKCSSELFARLNYDILRYNVDLKSWFFYNGKYWEEDVCGVHASTLAKEFFELMLRLVEFIDDEDKREKYVKHYFKYNAKLKRDILVRDSIDNLYITNDEFDNNGDLLNCQNGTFELDTLVFREQRAEDMITKLSNIVYDNAAESDVWERFVEDVIPDDADKRVFLQKALAYSITGNPENDQFFIIHGATTRNGKSTLLNTMAYALGSYSANASPDTLALKPRDSKNASEDIARLNGVRFLNVSEPPKQMEFDVALLKILTGGDKVTARQLYKASFEFYPRFVLFINTNYLPKVSDMTLFESSRVHVISFNRHFSKEKQDASLGSKLKSPEIISGLFNWLIAGLKQLRSEGLTPPLSVVEDTRRYAENSDKFIAFLNECLIKRDGSAVTSKAVFDRYTEWCNLNDYPPDGKYAFMEKLRVKNLLSKSATVDGKTVRNVIVGYTLVNV